MNSKPPYEPSGLKLIDSEHLVLEEEVSGRDICNFLKKKSLARKECDVFLELGSFQQYEATTRDAILVDKVIAYSNYNKKLLLIFVHN